MDNEPKQVSPVEQLLDQERRLEDKIRLFEQMFGVAGHPDHDTTKFYMQGRLDGIRYTMRILDM